LSVAFLLLPLQYIRIRTLSMYITVRNIRKCLNAVILQWKRVVCCAFNPPRRPFRIPSARQCSLQQRFRNRPPHISQPLVPSSVAMDLVGRLFLRVVHFFYSLFLAILSIRSRYFRPTPRPLTATRSKIPSHLALVLVSQEPDLCISDAQEALLRCTENAIACCRAAGIQRLSVYDRQGSSPHRDVVQSSQ
jgi:hypothetical protein